MSAGTKREYYEVGGRNLRVGRTVGRLVLYYENECECRKENVR